MPFQGIGSDQEEVKLKQYYARSKVFQKLTAITIITDNSYEAKV